MKKLLILATLFAFGFSACKKNKDKDCSLSEKNLVGSYKITSMKYKETASSPETEALSDFYDVCELDDILTFLSNKTYQYRDAGTKCSFSGDEDGTWSLSGKTLNVEGQVVPIDNFTCAGFTIIVTGFDVDGDQAKLTYTRQP